MTVAGALLDMALAALLAAAVAVVWAEALCARADRRYAEDLREFKRVADERAARARAARERSRTAAEYAFEVAERQRLLARADAGILVSEIEAYLAGLGAP